MHFKAVLTLIMAGLLLTSLSGSATANGETHEFPAMSCKDKVELNHSCLLTFFGSVADHVKKKFQVSVRTEGYNVVMHCGVEVKVSARRHVTRIWRGVRFSRKQFESIRDRLVSRVQQQVRKEVAKSPSDTCSASGEVDYS